MIIARAVQGCRWNRARSAILTTAPRRADRDTALILAVVLIHHSRKIRNNCCHKHLSRFMTVAKFPSCRVRSSRFMTIHDTPQVLRRDLLPVGDMLSNALNFLALLPAAPLGWIACCLRIRGRSSAAQQNPSTSSQTYVIGPTRSSRAVDLHVRTDIEEAAMMRETRGE